MALPSDARYDFIPTASIIAFIFVGVFMVISLIGRCLALNQSTIHSGQNLDLVIFRAPPKANPPQQRARPLADMQFGANNNRDHRTTLDAPMTPVTVQRGPKNL
ncbi:unnamed protein product [Rotaria magnacalcarata]|uniref:Uncharacterized protein n=2 Tax=Rotaria magnacalcarata TaxID=392030 RepID=A0A816LMZ4_9BILA|nr:unnamed protein product [Rotaria magnacalcarata]CAF1531090.1 unnamed protein product [Rotaria magnacalcarata]CAF1962622.1 unnamed protein product [Rotaria magnacalcarata]CAF2138529.1 unnamed protein product [Rotaria magnacalcarata]CAF2157009.1 unnamed protein product [Rotaria magnacalcarata]